MIVLVMILCDRIANGIGRVDADFAGFVRFGLFLFLVAFVFFFAHDDGSIVHGWRAWWERSPATGIADESCLSNRALNRGRSEKKGCPCSCSGRFWVADALPVYCMLGFPFMSRENSSFVSPLQALENPWM